MRRHMPTIAFEEGSRALPVDWRRCRITDCGDGAEEGLGPPQRPAAAGDRLRPRRRLPRGERRRAKRRGSTAPAGGPARSTSSTGSTTPTRPPASIPVVGPLDEHADDWESVQVRIGPDGSVAQRASSHHGYNYERSVVNGGSDAGIDLVREVDRRRRPARGERLGAGDRAARGLRRLATPATSAERPRHPLHPRPPRPPRPARADRRPQPLDLRRRAALAEAGLARPRGRGTDWSDLAAFVVEMRRRGKRRPRASAWHARSVDSSAERAAAGDRSVGARSAVAPGRGRLCARLFACRGASSALVGPGGGIDRLDAPTLNEGDQR